VARLSETPAKLASTEEEDLEEALYDRRDRREHVLSASRQSFEAGIPDDDPYREMLWSHTDGAATIRWLTYSSSSGSKKDYKSFLMNIDLAMRYRPIYRYLNLVYEGRFLGQPQKTHLDLMIKRPQVRSLYAMVDDLPYNVFIMGGYYLPLFGHFVPDHTLLTQRMLSKAFTGSPQGAYNVLFKAYSVGTAPNVPYLNVHRIIDRMGKADGSSPTEGWAANAGLRFVTLGASINYSIWQTTEAASIRQKEQGSTIPRRTLLHSLNFTSTLFLNRWYLGLDAISIEQDDDSAFRRSGVVNLDTKIRLWREIYMMGLWALARSDEQLMPGFARESQVGFTSFLIPGLQWTIAYTKGQEQSDGQEAQHRQALMSQVHAYL
jgi:hypothetical protein